jgi:transcriptional regulator with XRE-family HTH domain
MGTPNAILRAVRRSRTLKQADMARLLGVSQAVYSYYESGFRTPPYEAKVRIAAILGATIETLWPSEASSETTVKR